MTVSIFDAGPGVAAKLELSHSGLAATLPAHSVRSALPLDSPRIGHFLADGRDEPVIDSSEGRR